jgi:hypothetical protein
MRRFTDRHRWRAGLVLGSCFLGLVALPAPPAAAADFVVIGSLSSNLTMTRHTDPTSPGLSDVEVEVTAQVVAAMTQDNSTNPPSTKASITLQNYSITTTTDTYTCTSTLSGPETLTGGITRSASRYQNQLRSFVVLESLVAQDIQGERTCSGDSPFPNGPAPMQLYYATGHCEDGPTAGSLSVAAGVRTPNSGPYPQYESRGTITESCTAVFETPDETTTTQLTAVSSTDLHREPTADDYPSTSLEQKPKKKTTQKKAVFKFKTKSRGAEFTCSLDGKPYVACTSPLTVKVKQGKHTMRILAQQYGLTEFKPAKWTWTYKKPKPN